MKIRKNLVFMIMLLAGFLTACAAEPAAPEPPATEAAVIYKVTVLTEEGGAVAGAMVQLCSHVCIPGMTDEKGVAEFEVPQDDYKVSVISVPEGYTYDGAEQDVSFAPGSREVTILLQKTK